MNLLEQPLSKGAHPNPQAGLCVQEYLNLYKGFEHSDAALPCQSEELATFLRIVNDQMPYESRQQLRELGIRSLGTANDGKQLERAFQFADAAVRRFAPMALPTHEAAKLRNLDPIVDPLTARAAISAAYAAAAAARAAAARAAAARAAAAAADAARAAARDAAAAAAARAARAAYAAYAAADAAYAAADAARAAAYAAYAAAAAAAAADAARAAAARAAAAAADAARAAGTGDVWDEVLRFLDEILP